MTTYTTQRYVKLGDLCTISHKKTNLETLQNNSDYVAIRSAGVPNLYYWNSGTSMPPFKSGYFFISSNSEILNTQYLYCYLSTHKHELDKIASGKVQKNINKMNLFNLEILVPSLEEQLNIVKSFDNMRARIAKLTNELLDVNAKINSSAFFENVYNRSCGEQFDSDSQIAKKSRKDNLDKL